MNNSLILNKLDRLIKLFMTSGVQPSDLADNIFLNHYKRISFFKENNFLIGELVFDEDLNGVKVNSTLRYYYKDKHVMLIEEEFLNVKKIIWNREEKTSILLEEIVSLIKDTHSSKEVEYFISTLPADLSSKLQTYFTLSA
ncbi:hypothetical protein AB0Y38_03795 [Lysinibacillus capsici]|uniref:hypothetical protein n=1 Tax=Lysinibacillus capsici TaxID=2115968 RepID=UPI003F1F9907